MRAFLRLFVMQGVLREGWSFGVLGRDAFDLVYFQGSFRQRILLWFDNPFISMHAFK